MLVASALNLLGPEDGCGCSSCCPLLLLAKALLFLLPWKSSETSAVVTCSTILVQEEGVGARDSTQGPALRWLLLTLLSAISQGLCLASWPWNYKCQGQCFLLMLQKPKKKNKNSPNRANLIEAVHYSPAQVSFWSSALSCLDSLPGAHPDAWDTPQDSSAVSVLHFQHKLSWAPACLFL